MFNMYKLKVVRESEASYNMNKIKSSTDVVNLIRDVFELEGEPEEHFVMLALDTKNNVIASFRVAHGNINSVTVDVASIYRRALLVNAAQIIVAHNHPSQSTRPSNEDIFMTKRIKEAGDILSVRLLDHIIITDKDYYSFAQDDRL